MSKLENLLQSNNINAELINFDSTSTHTAQDAAKALGCEVGQIIRTLVFNSENRYFLVIICGDRKVDMQKLKQLVRGKRPELASPEKVVELTGYKVGGVPCVMEVNLPIYIDKGIINHKVVYSGGGDANTVMKIDVEEILKFWKVECVYISKE